MKTTRAEEELEKALRRRYEERLRDLVVASERVAVLQPGSNAKTADESERWATFYEAVNESLVDLAFDETLDQYPARYLCAEHGLGVSADEDGCCTMCGRDCAVVAILIPPPEDDEPARPKPPVPTRRERWLREAKEAAPSVLFLLLLSIALYVMQGRTVLHARSAAPNLLGGFVLRLP